MSEKSNNNQGDAGRPAPKFNPGQVVMTRACAEFLRERGLFTNGSEDPGPLIRALLDRHISGDWGDVCPSDAQANNDALAEGDRLMSVYFVGDQKIWIITEWDRSVTTLLLPDDY